MKKTVAVVGMTAGDEGKAKINDYVVKRLLTLGKTIGMRYQGGGNAGHTTVKDGVKYKTHQVPSAIIRKNAYSLIGSGMFINPRKLLKEMGVLEEQGIKISASNFGISSKAHITLDYHTKDDSSSFNKEEHTSTGNGIKQTARDKANRTGIRFAEFLNPELMGDILREKVFPKSFPTELESIKEFVESYDIERGFLARFNVLENEIINNSKYEYLALEGAQGMVLDMDNGLYPGVTSSCPGLIPYRPDLIIGVHKAYNSSVGIGDRSFVAEMDKSLQGRLIKPWQEFGTTTGKPRHIGWFDVVQSRYYNEIVGVDEMALTCLDRLEELAKLGEDIQVVNGYVVGVEGNPERAYLKWDVTFDKRDVLPQAKQITEKFEPWDKTVERDGKTLTPNAQKYVSALEEMMGQKFALIGIGPDTNDLLVRKDIL